MHDLPSRVAHRHDPLQRGPLGRRRRGHHARRHGQSVLHPHAMSCWNGKNAEQTARQGSVSYCRRSSKSAKRLPNAPRQPPVVSPAICHVAPRARQARRLRPSWYGARIGEQGQQRFYFHPVGIGFHRFLFFWGYTSESSHFSQPRA